MEYRAIFPLCNFRITEDLRGCIERESAIAFPGGVKLRNFDKSCLEYWGKYVDYATPQHRESVHHTDYSLEYVGDDGSFSTLSYTYLFLWCVREMDVQVPYMFWIDETARWSYSSYSPSLYVHINRDDDDSTQVLADWTLTSEDIDLALKISERFQNRIVPSLGQHKYLSLKNAINFLHTGLMDRFWNTQAILYSVGLESLFSFSNIEISHRLAENIAWFHNPKNAATRVSTYKDAKKFYNYRSKIIHGGIPRQTDEEVRLTIWARKVLRTSIVKIIDEDIYIDLYGTSDDSIRQYYEKLVLSAN